MGTAGRAFFPPGRPRKARGLELRCVVFARSGRGLVLVRKDAGPAARDAWTLPGGPLPYGLHPRRAASQMLRDQVGAPAQRIRFFGVRSSMDPDWILTFQFEAEMGELPARAGRREIRLAGLASSLPPDLHPFARADLEMYHVRRRARGLIPA